MSSTNSFNSDNSLPNILRYRLSITHTHISLLVVVFVVVVVVVNVVVVVPLKCALVEEFVEEQPPHLVLHEHVEDTIDGVRDSC